MISHIVKRDGRQVPYEREKISAAIFKALKASGSASDATSSLDMAVQVEAYLENVEGIHTPSVEQIQDAVERVLIDNGYVRTAKAFILYRAERTRVREMNTRLMKAYEEITFADAKDSDIKRENANVDGDTAMGAMLKYGSEGAKQFYEMFVLKPEHAKAHKEGEIHIHDLDFLTLTTTCCQIDLLELFKDGFCTGHGVLRAPQDIASYSALACIGIQANQNDQHGGQSIVNFDYGLAPGVACTYQKRFRDNLIKVMEVSGALEDADDFVRKSLETLKKAGKVATLEPTADFDEALRAMLGDYPEAEAYIRRAHLYAHKETDRATYQAMEALVHNLNTMHSRCGAQTPFSSVNYGMDTSPEGRMVVKNMLLATESGLGNGETPIFPIQIFRVKEGISCYEGDPNYDLFKLACRVSSKRLFPNFSFVDAPFNLQYYKPDDIRTQVAYMGCRTRVMGNVHDPEREIANGRGNLSFTSINLPRIALRSNGNITLFFDELERKLTLVVDQLMERFEIQARKKVRNFPFLMGEGIWIDSQKLDWEDEVREVLKHGSLSIGFIGLAETLKALIGEHHGQSQKAQNLGLEIIGFMREFTDRESQKRKLNFTVLATPGEGLSGRFVALDRKLFGAVEGVTDREYYTNGFHVPVYFPITAIEKIRKEAPYHALTNAGHITYVELDGDPSQNLEAFEDLVHAMKDCGVGYGSINHPIDRDTVCGYNGVIGDHCPKCGRAEEQEPFERIRRITGYLVGTLDRFNNAKRAEERDRVKHGVGCDCKE